MRFLDGLNWTGFVDFIWQDADFFWIVLNGLKKTKNQPALAHLPNCQKNKPSKKAKSAKQRIFLWDKKPPNRLGGKSQ